MANIWTTWLTPSRLPLVNSPGTPRARRSFLFSVSPSVQEVCMTTDPKSAVNMPSYAWRSPPKRRTLLSSAAF